MDAHALKTEVMADRLQEFLSFGEEFFSDIVQTFFDAANGLLQSLWKWERVWEEEGPSDEVLKNVQGLTHTLKGSVLNLGFKKLAAQVEKLNQLARAGDLDAYFAEFAEIEKEVQRLQAIKD